MKVAYASDLHLDDIPQKIAFERIVEINKVTADYLILAGDICSNENALYYFDKIKPNVKKVIYVRGNHEYYGNHIGYKVQYPKHVHALEYDTPLILDDVRFIGDTLWTNIPDSVSGSIQRFMNDYRAIYKNHHRGEMFDTDMVNALFAEHSYGIKDSLENATHKPKTVVITHHSPSFMGVDPKYAGNILNVAFHTDYIETITDFKPDIWVHGHCHDNIDYVHENGIRVVCNPYGYYRERPFNEIKYFSI